jgi:hypothetical protein
MQPKLFFAAVFLTIALQWHCQKDKTNPLLLSETWAYHEQFAWNPTNTAGALLGEWVWAYTGCVDPNSPTSPGLSILFKADSTLEVRQDGNLIQVSTWAVVNGSSGYYALRVEPAVGEVAGNIIFGEDKVQFHYSYIDRCDHYFERK